MATTHPRCSVCTHPHAATINTALAYAFSYRRINEWYGVSLGALSRHSNHHRPREASEEGEKPSLEQRVGQLEGEVELFRLLFGIGESARREWEMEDEVERQGSDEMPF
ncbi:MAG: hypothetical protein ACE5GX_11305 [Thermoanaerobaculia bacterium]